MKHRMIRELFFLLFSIFSWFHSTNAGTFSVDYTNHVFLKDGKPFRYLSGSFHYFRIHQDLWDDRLKRIRALGLNTIQTYVPWNLHEPTQGNFDFSGPNNLTRFLTLAQQNELNVLLRVTPYINGEFEFGGMPYWLLKIDGIQLRSSSPSFTNAVQSYYNVLLDLLKPYLYKNGGPVLMLQVENEYGSQQACDHNYTSFLRDAIWNKVGNDVVLWTTDNPRDIALSCGRVPMTLTTVDFAPDDNLTNIDQHFQFQDKYSNGAPRVNSEFYSNWFLYWGAPSSFQRDFSGNFLSSLSHMYHVNNASVNIYLVLAGTNFGFYNGEQWNGEILTSYWIGAPIGENGNITDMYRAIHSFIGNLTNWEQPPLPIPANNPASNYGQVQMKRIGSNLITTLTQIQETCSSTQDPQSFEQLDHPYGFVLYTTTLKTGGKILSTPNIGDYGYVFVNNVYQGMLLRNSSTTLSLITPANQGDVLRILVENRGRQCFWHNDFYPPIEFKGLNQNVTLDNSLLQGWYQCGINLTKASIDSISNNSFVKEKMEILPDKAVSQPGIYIGQFNANVLQDTYFDSTGWGKGQLFVNGYNVGRYWPQMGPQMTLYVPSPIIQPKNTVVLIELIGAQQNYVNFIDHPNLIFKN